MTTTAAREAKRYEVREMSSYGDGKTRFAVVSSDVRLEERYEGDAYDTREAAEAACARLKAMAEAAEAAVAEPEDTKPKDEEKPEEAKEQRATASGNLFPRDLTGRLWEIVVIQEGRSTNGLDYPGDVLARDYHVFEGAPLRVTWDALDHHDEVGQVRGVECRVVDGRKAIVGMAEIADDAARKRLLAEWRAGDPLEFSIDAIVRAGEGKRVTSFVRATEVTIVRRGAAGGRALRAVAGQGGQAMSGATAEIEAQLARAKKAADELERTVKVAESKALVARKLAGEKLPAPALERVRESLDGKVVSEAEVDAAVKREREYLARVTASGHRVEGCGPVGVEVGAEPSEKMQAALEGLFAQRDVKLRTKEGKDRGIVVPRYKSIRRAAEDYTGRRLTAEEIMHLLSRGKPLHQRAREAGLTVDEQRARESVTAATFANAFVDTMRKRMLEGYAKDDHLRQLKLLCGRNWGTNVPDFRAQTRFRVGGYGVLPTVAERGTYNPLTSPADEKGTFTIAKKGGTEDITLEAIAADDVRLIARIPDELRYAAILTLYQAILGLFNLELSATGNAIDGSKIFRSGNYTANAFSKTEMNLARLAMRDQAAFGNALDVLGIRNLPKIWWGPGELEETVEILAGSRAVVGATNQAATEEPNIHKGLMVEVVDFWTDTANCMVTADPMATDTVEVGFFEGREEPELFVQDVPNVGSQFDLDAITYKIRHIWGYAVLDHRSFYGFSRA